MLASHLVENEVRGGMSFWDKATGVLALREVLQSDLATTISLRELEGKLKEIGLPTNRTTLSQYLFAPQALVPLGHDLRACACDKSSPDIACRSGWPRASAAPRRSSVTAVFRPTQEDLAASLPHDASVQVDNLLAIAEVRLAGSRFIKIVEGMPGNEVTMQGRDVFINGAYVGTAKSASSRGEPLELGPTGRLPPGRYFVWTPHRDSLDSRYALTGWVNYGQVVGTARTLF